MASPTVNEKAISIPFAIDSAGNVSATTSYEVIWADRVKSAIGTIKGQRLMRSIYGSGISQAYMDTVREMSTVIEKEVIRIFSSQFAVLELEQVVVNFIEESNVLDVTVFYKLPSQQSTTTRVAMAYIDTNDLIQEVNL